MSRLWNESFHNLDDFVWIVSYEKDLRKEKHWNSLSLEHTRYDISEVKDIIDN